MILRIEAFKKAKYERDPNWSEEHFDVNLENYPKLIEKYCFRLAKANKEDLKEILYVNFILSAMNGSEILREVFFREDEYGLFRRMSDVCAYIMEGIVNLPKMQMISPNIVPPTNPANQKSNIIL